MMGPRQEAQAALFFEFSLEGHVPQDHLLRSIDRFVDLTSVRAHLADFCSHTGRPSVDPELLIRMLLVGFCFGIRSERRQGKELKRTRQYHKDPRNKQPRTGRRKYRASKLVCSVCPAKEKCCPKVDARSVTRERFEEVREFAHQCTASAFNSTAQKRRKKVEMLFAHLKRILGLGRLRLRGPCGVQDEFTLAATAQNLRKLAKLKPFALGAG